MQRIYSNAFAKMVMPVEDAAALITSGSTMGMSGFTGAGYPKAVPGALAQRITEVHARGGHFTTSPTRL